MNKEFVFGICADVHQGLWDVDETWRMEKFVGEAKERNADFIIQLGDLTYPNEFGDMILKVWNSFEGGKYHVLGNHDTEFGGKEFIMNYWGMKEKYYSFDRGDFHFVVLDTNYTKANGGFMDYKDDEHKGINSGCYIPDFELKWLLEDLLKTDKRTFIFTHATLALGEWIVYNYVEFMNVLWKVNQKAGYNKVTMCFSGHDHADGYLLKGGVHYFMVNSMSKKIIGPNYLTDSKDSEFIKNNYENPTHVINYKEPLYMFVKIKENGFVQIIGKQSEYDNVSPLEARWDHFASPQIAYREVWLDGRNEF